MGLFNAIKRLPLICVQQAFGLCCCILKLARWTTVSLCKRTRRFFEHVLTGIVNEPERVLIIGIRNAGKSALLYRIKLGEFIQTVGYNYTLICSVQVPTNSFIEEECYLCSVCLIPVDTCVHCKMNNAKGIHLQLCEFGIADEGDTVENHLRVKSPPLTNNQLQYASKVVFLLDGSEYPYRDATLRDIVKIVTQHNFFHQSPKYVIFNNKTDIVGSSTNCCLDFIQLQEHIKIRTLWVNGSALTGQGIVDALSFLLFDDPLKGILRENKQKEDLIQFG
ncbi:ADP-ribosylation factor, putative [Babesia bigemina]|uniref:ADP-ribosylation factor, putative n=1 Tax=Babesia bigemina TaxID=5866 RepID=A0A061D023_BABBI|nr:ADP-ribosylation factor, putative [Babesia bigemina]CDR94191.1 ADP-ribosylation factor, putative [Babesia bigemina]|eukprot:XP_012766377.1 ADP-ribosylation factor, putative [Babesia bigemina]